jgi:hypothetical protein
MKSAETLLACCVVGLACFIGGQTFATRRAPVHAEAAGAIDLRAPRPVVLIDRSARHLEETLVNDALLVRSERPTLSPADMRRRISNGIEGTYVRELLLARDSAIARWPDRTTRPLRVFVGESEQLTGWNNDYLPAVRDAFDTWVQAGIPVRFVFVVDSASADVHVRFIDRFPNGISGKTVWSRDINYWLVTSDIQLAISHPGGGTVTAPQMRAIALHEVGHLLGLDHSSDPDNIMSARVRVRELSEIDRASVRLLYSVPAGSLRN